VARIGIGRRFGNVFVWTSAMVSGFIVTCLAIIGIFGIAALLIGIFSR